MVRNESNAERRLSYDYTSSMAYRDALPFYGYHEVASSMGNQMNGFHPQKGDVVVIENGKHSIWGHIAIYTGNCWISDFKQKTMSPYRKPVPYKIFRHV